MASVSQRGDEDRLDGVHAVLGLLEGEVVLRLEHVVGDLEPVRRCRRSRRSACRASVSVSWNAGRQCMNLTCGLPLAFISSVLTWYGISRSMRSFQTSFGSPIETQTSVWMKSTPSTACLGSSVMVSLRAVLLLAARGRSTTYSSAGHSFFGPQMRTSMPIRQPTIISEWPMLLRVSPRKAYLISVDRLVAVLAHRHHVGEHLRRVVLVGQAVEDRHAGVLRERLDAVSGSRRGTRSRRTSGRARAPCP